MFKKEKQKEKFKVSDVAFNLLINEAMPKLNLTLPLSMDDVVDIANYFYDEEAGLANSKESYNEEIDEERLQLVCRVADEFNTEPFDIDNLNSRLKDQ